MFHISSTDGPKMRRLYARVHIVMIAGLLIAAIAADAGLGSDVQVNQPQTGHWMILSNQ